MDPSQREEVQMFMTITGASEEVATRIIQANRGDLNAAVNNFYNEGEDSLVPMQNQVTTGNIEVMEVDEQPTLQRTHHRTVYPLPSAPILSRRFRGLNTFPRENPSRGIAIVTQPRDIREVPIEWKDEEQRRVTFHEGLLIEEIPDTEGVNLPSQRHAHFITDDEEVSGPASSLRSEGERSRSSFDPFWKESMPRIGNVNAPSISESPATANIEGDDLDQELLRAAIEASQKDAMGMHSTEDQGEMHAEDDDLARAVSLSLKTAEREKALREGNYHTWLSEEDFVGHEDGGHRDILKRKGSTSAGNDYALDPGVSSRIPLQVGLKTLSSNINHVPIISQEEVEADEEQPLFRKRTGRRLNPAVTGSSNTEFQESYGQGISQDDVKQYEEQPLTRLNRHLNPNLEEPELHEEPIMTRSIAPMPSGSNGDVAHQDEWGVLTSEEQEEAVMLEAAMFGTLPEDAARRFRYPSLINTVVEENGLDDSGSHYSRPIQPPSPTVIAQRLLRERQDDEYLASLQADREKDVNAQREAEQRRLEEEIEKALAIEAEKRREEEKLQQRLAEEEFERQKAAKRAALPKEPPVDDDAAVNLMVRMPDGTRQGRRFRKSEHLQCLFNFIDANTQVAPGSYRLVRQYPRKAFTDAEHENSLHDLGLSNNETLFLELI